MNWRTEIGKIEMPFNINHQSKLFSLGSCFSNAMGKRFLEAKFSTVVNPFGVLFNPLSIARLFEKEDFHTLHFVKVNEVFHHLDVHSSLHSEFKSELIDALQTTKKDFNQQLISSDVVFITFGTAYVYEFLETKKVIANCHKLPANKFSKRLLKVKEIVASFEQIAVRYPEKQFVFTVSPVRHTKEGLSENMLSKSILRVACGELSEIKNAHYFPSYEMVLDDLRDYRFYTDDLIHVNKQGEEYIWEQVKKTFFDKQTINLLEGIEKVKNKIHHRPFNPNTEAHQVFLSKTIKEVEELNKKLNFEEELKALQIQVERPNKK